jgi:hypothetical protein
MDFNCHFESRDADRLQLREGYSFITAEMGIGHRMSAGCPDMVL